MLKFIHSVGVTPGEIFEMKYQGRAVIAAGMAFDATDGDISVVNAFDDAAQP